MAISVGAITDRANEPVNEEEAEILRRGWHDSMNANRTAKPNVDLSMRTWAPNVHDPSEITAGKYSGLGGREDFDHDITPIAEHDDWVVAEHPGPPAGAQLWDETQKQYPRLKDYPIDYAYTPKAGADMMESYAPEEEQRPANFPKGRFGLEVFRQDAKPLDLLGDVASHYAVYHDPKMQQLYEQFQKDIPKEGQAALKDLYEESKRDDNEKRPYEDWLKQSGMPAYLRGRLVDQFKPTDYPGAYSPDQLKVLDQMKQYLGIKSPDVDDWLVVP